MSRGFERPPWWAIVAIVAGIAAVAVLVPLAVLRHPKDPLSKADAARMEAAESQAAAKEAASKEFDALFFGDSITFGAGRDKVTDPRAADVAAEDLGWRVRVSGHPGTGYINNAKFDKTYPESIGLALQDAKFKVVVLQGSSNDASVDAPSGRLEAAIDEVIHTVQKLQPQAKIVMIGPYSTNGIGLSSVRDVLSAKAEQYNLPFIDPLKLGWMAGHPEYVSPDGYHPNSAGHVYLGHLWAEELRKVLPADLTANATASATPST